MSRGVDRAMSSLGKRVAAGLLMSAVCTMWLIGPATAGAKATVTDNRVYEKVTPDENHNANVFIPTALPPAESLSNGTRTQLPFQVSENGDAVTYQAESTVGGVGNTSNGHGDQYLARRMPTGGWIQIVIQPPGRNATTYQGFSSDLSTGLLVSGTESEPRLPPLSAEAQGDGLPVLYACAFGEEACTTSQGGSPEKNQNPYRPLFGVSLNRPAFGTQGFGRRGLGVVTRGEASVIPVFAGSAGSNNLLFEANDALIPGEGVLEAELDSSVKSEIANNLDGNYLYEAYSGGLSLVDVLPDGRVVGNATFGAAPFSGTPTFDPPNFDGVVSDDGSRVFWTDLNSGIVYVRVNGVDTVQVSLGSARYWTSADDGRYAFYTEGDSLYRFDVQTGERKTLVGAGVIGVIGVSENGSNTYFVAETMLGSGENGEGVAPAAEQPNLYVIRGAEAPVFIATLSPNDGNSAAPFIRARSTENGEYGDWQPGLANRTARVATNGESVVFMSNQSLKAVGHPNGYPSGGLAEVYVFEAGVNSLYCVSCGADGEPPSLSEAEAAAFLPISWNDTYLPRWISEDGSQVFFDSAVPLVPEDTNGAQDAYEWEREGSGSCTAGSAVNGGCVFVLSGGTSRAESWLVGASASGKDVFVNTRARLTAEDQNEAFDLYDARVGGVTLPVPPVCTGTGCQGLPEAPPTFATPPSGTFSGVGNFSPPVGSSKSVKKGSAKAQERSKALRSCRKLTKSRRKACEARVRAGDRHRSVSARKTVGRGR